MRKLIVTNIVSLDGCVAGQGGDVMAMPMDHFFNANNAERLREADTLLLGRNSYMGFKSYWPERHAAPDAHEHEPEISRRNNEIDKVVVSDTLTEDDTDPWRDTTEIVRRAEAHERVAALKEGEGGDILVFGSRTLWNDLLAAGLVDGLDLLLGAKIVDGGTPAFQDTGAHDLRLLETRRLEGSENLLVRYAVA